MNMRQVPKELEAHIKPELMLELFSALDTDGNGDVSRDEFVDGLMSLTLAKHNQVPSETVLLLKMMHSSRSKNRDIENLLRQVHARVVLGNTERKSRSHEG